MIMIDYPTIHLDTNKGKATLLLLLLYTLQYIMSIAHAPNNINRRPAYSRVTRVLLIQTTPVYLCFYAIWCIANVFMTVLSVSMLK